MADVVPPWKFWHPLPFWQAVLIAFVMQIVCILPIVALREGAGIMVPEWVGSGIAGGLMFVVIRLVARRRLAAGK